MTGQDAVPRPRRSTRLELDGVILTKLDGDARGGAALVGPPVTGVPVSSSARARSSTPLELFHPEEDGLRISGMGDILTFVEKAQDQVDEKQAKELERKLRKNDFTLEDFRDQLMRLKKMESMEEILGMIPGLGAKAKELKGSTSDESELKRVVAIIDSMTAQERRNARILNGRCSEADRRGSGTTAQDANRLMKNFQQAEAMIQRMTKGGMRGMGQTSPFPGRECVERNFQ